MKKQSIGEMGLRLGIDASVATFMGCVATKVLPRNPTVGTAMLVTIGGGCIGWTLAEMCGDMIIGDLNEIGEAFAKAKQSINEAKKEAEA